MCVGKREGEKEEEQRGENRREYIGERGRSKGIVPTMLASIHPKLHISSE